MTQQKQQTQSTAVDLAELEQDLAYYEKQKEQMVANLNAALGAAAYVKMKIDQLKSGRSVPSPEEVKAEEETDDSPVIETRLTKGETEEE
jgi:hypothetical protein